MNDVAFLHESGDVGCSAPQWSNKPCSVRVDQSSAGIVLRFATADSLWELLVPDETAPVDCVRLHLREFSNRRGAEASVPVPLTVYVEIRNWLRCIPDGRCSPNSLEPALAALRAAFSPLFSTLFELDDHLDKWMTKDRVTKPAVKPTVSPRLSAY